MEAKEELSRLIKEFNNGNTDSFVQIMDIVKEARKLGLSVRKNDHYHGLGKKLYIKVIQIYIH